MPNAETRSEELDLRLTLSAERTLQHAALDAPPKPAPRLARRLNQPSVFEEESL